MQFMASSRSAGIIIAGLLLCLAGPAGAQQSDAGTPDATANTSDTNPESATDAPMAPNRPVKQRAKKPLAAQSQLPAKVASKPSTANKKADDAQALRDDPGTGGIPPSVTNAKAQVGAGVSADGTPKAMPGQTDNLSRMTRQVDPATPPADASATGPDAASVSQTSDADRNMSQVSPSRDRPPAILATAAVQTSYSASNVDSTWGRTSLIGKVFVAIGGLLTLASAARMFVA